MGLGSLFAGSALPDIVSVTVNGTASGSGNIASECFFDPTIGGYDPGCFQPGAGSPYFQFSSYSFSGTNTQLGAFSAGGNTGSTGMAVIPASIEGHSDQNTVATSGALDITLTGGHSVTAFSYSYSETSNVSASFVLTEQSVVQLVNALTLFTDGATLTSTLLDSHGNVVLTLPVDGQVSATLQSGAYQLDSSASASGAGNFAFNTDVVDFQSLLDATFTPVVTPEPRWAFFAALLAVALGGYVLTGRRRVS
jgi:hypothetical protein